MADSLEERNKKRVQKHQMLQEFESVKKGYLKSFLLCWIFGFIGAHRFYLGHHKIGMAIAAGWLLVLAFGLFKLELTELAILFPFIMVYLFFVGLELFLITRTTDRVNAKIRAELEAKHYT